MERGRAGIKSPPFREKKGRGPAKWTTIYFLKGSSFYKMILLKRESPGFI